MVTPCCVRISMDNKKDSKSSSEKSEEKKPPCKPCCACPETRKARDECIVKKGEMQCQDLIEAHNECLRKLGFKI